MIRKEAPEQNDISLIIGNLPRRLQRKIVEDCSKLRPTAISDRTEDVEQCAVPKGNTIVDNEATAVINGNVESLVVAETVNGVTMGSQDAEHVRAEGAAAAKTVVGIPRLLKMPANNEEFERPAPLRGIISSKTPNHSKAGGSTTPNRSDTHKETAKDGTALVPGILHVKVMETSQLMNVEKSAGRHENGKNPKRAPRSTLSAKIEMQSPMHQSPKNGVSLPPWYREVDNSNEFKQLHDALITQIRHNAVLENWEHFLQIHGKLQQVFMQLVLHHLKFCCEQKADTFFWRTLFYNIRQYLKGHKSPMATTRTLTLLEVGIRFYSDLHIQLEAKFLSATALHSGSSRSHMHKFGTIAKVATQKVLICLGDLSRYKTKHLDSGDYTAAAKYYQQAQCLLPTNGIPYNQLAILAILDHKNFDAVYFHVRSLMSSNSISSAKESLLVLFDEMRKKYEEIELKSSPVHTITGGNGKSSKPLRKEVWIYPDGVRRSYRTNLNGCKIMKSEEMRYMEMAPEDLRRRFTSLYLYIIGKLYTCIGLESMQEHQTKLFLQLDVLLKRDILIKSREKLLKIVALNIFILEHNKLRDTRREVRHYAFHFCNQMFGLILRKCNVIISQRSSTCDEESFTDLNTTLQYIKIYVDWLELAQDVYVWEPKSEQQTIVDAWIELEQLFENINTFLSRNAKSSGEPDSVQAILEEDNFFAGFTPLTAKISQPYDGVPSSEVEQCYERITRILSFQCICQENERRFSTDSYNLEMLNTEVANIFKNLQSKIDSDNDENVNTNINQNKESDTKLNLENYTDDTQIQQLSKLKKELETKANVNKMYSAKLAQILNFVDTKVYIEVRPKYLLPDTNCFIDCLEDIENLLQQQKRFVIVVPLTVVKELDGLSKGAKMESSEQWLQHNRVHYLDDVTSRAKKSLEFFKTAKNHIKFATSKGSIINSSLFALVEEQNVSNDDKILATALALSKTVSTEICEGGKYLIQTELVLITTDRNLRVKALARNLAVSEFNEFLHWANESNT